MTHLGILLLSGFVVLNAAAVVAEEDQEGCEVRIGAVMASNSGRGLDPELVSFKRQFDSLFPYNSYHLIEKHSRHVRWGKRAAFDLPGGRYLLVTPRGLRDGHVSLKILLIDGSRPLVDTRLSLRNHGTLLVGGPRHREGVLIIAIGARAKAAKVAVEP